MQGKGKKKRVRKQNKMQIRNAYGKISEGKYEGAGKQTAGIGKKNEVLKESIIQTFENTPKITKHDIKKKM